MRRILLITITCMSILSCATTPKSMTPDDRKMIDLIEGKYMTCLGEQTRAYIDGSDDVNFLVKHIVSLCEPVLSEVDRKIQERGFSPNFSRGYVGAIRNDGRELTTSFVLRQKAEKKKQ